MTILKFHPESNQFRVETLLEKKVREAELKAEYTEFEINHYRTEEVSQPGGSQPDVSQPGPSHRVQLPQLDLRARLKLVTLPVVPNRSAMWNAVRQATIRPQANDLPQLDPVMIERALTQRDLTVQPHRLTTFIPPKPVEVVPSSLQNEFDIRDSMIKNEFDEIFSPHPHGPKLNYEVIKGVDIINSPDFIKPFQLELKRGLEKGQRTFSRLKVQCQYLSTIPDISATREGQYLAKMFMIEHAVDKNQILHTINQRLLAIAERGELILKTTKDIGFENIWIASTDLIFNPATSKYETQLVKNKRTYAFTMEGDPQARMVFIADSFHLPPHPVLERKQDPFKVVLHETTHLGADMADLAIYPLPQKGFEISGRELLDAYHENFPQIINSKAFNDFVDRLAVEQNLPSLSSEAVLTALHFDDMLRVNLQMEDAEMIAVIVRDLYEGRSFDLKKRVARSADERSLGDQLATIFQNYALSSIFNIDQYHLSPHLDKRQEQEKTKKSTDAPEKIEVEKEQDKSTADVKREVEKKSILNVIATGIEKSNGRRSTNRKSANIGELAIN